MKHIEVELRGPLDNTTHRTLEEYLIKNGEKINTQKRIFFDLSQTIGINNRTLDVRVKITNGHIQIVIKKSNPGDVAREEAEVSVAENNLPQALHTLALLGYPKGVYGDRRITRYKVTDVEFAIQDVINISDGKLHSRFYEAEIMADPNEQKEAEENLRKILKDLGLSVFDKEGWNEYEKKMNAEANGWYDFATTDISGFISKN